MPHARRELLLWLFALGLITGGVLIMVYRPAWHAPVDAMIISGILMVSVDKYVKLRLRDDIAHDVFFAALGVHLPNELKDEILAIGECKLVRRKMIVTYKLTPHHDPGFVCAETVTEFEMHNLTHHTQEFEHNVWVGRSPSGVTEPPQPILYLRAQDRRGKIEYELRSHDIQLEQRDHERGWHSCVKIAPGGYARFWSTTVQILPSRFEDIYLLLQPTVGIRVSVECPVDMVPSVSFDHRLEADAACLPLNTWEFSGAFLPYSTFRIAWRALAVGTGAVDIGPRLQIKDSRSAAAVVRQDIG